MPVMFAGAAAIATLTLLDAAPPSGAGTVVASGSQVLQAPPSGTRAGIITVDDGGVNDNGQTSGDIFTQNAQDQSTA